MRALGRLPRPPPPPPTPTPTPTMPTLPTLPTLPTMPAMADFEADLNNAPMPRRICAHRLDEHMSDVASPAALCNAPRGIVRSQRATFRRQNEAAAATACAV
ncbi:uncharacterized protein SETTUDRAFT_34334 [Exserohilum turcica Et28A]|uniref:Uncharacterized protein n=1 Tax=Exserohilum turcicum (strain 28A) TaxID=671987 RepID=R0IC59_EXST2|nr:uncharacterized protein SETTUDRAFT_34334 [Exserohilum turcica Et28A]EOA82806.1 hypothetical protein SETTUDRAFT_34334 [Exserohilum turcica Et28A]